MLHNLLIFLDVGDAHDVGKYACGSYACTSAVALDEHGVFTIALRGEQHDVVAAFQSVEWMTVVHRLQRYTRLAVVHLCHKAPALVFSLQFLSASLKVSIQRRQILPEVVPRAIEEGIRHE